jgi:hypothetical protein
MGKEGVRVWGSEEWECRCISQWYWEMAVR